MAIEKQDFDSVLDTSIARIVTDIPDFKSMLGWKQVPILPSNQPLVCLNDLEDQYPLRVSPQYYLQGIKGSTPEMYLRKGAAYRLIGASQMLPKGFSFIFFDGYRSLDVQAALFNSFKEQLTFQHQDATEEKIIEMTQTYVSLPSADPLKPSPHATGGAIDLSITDSHGNLLEMGTDFDSFEPSAQTAYFKYNSEGKVYHLNRLLLYSVMISNGFTNYPEEWWHYDYGNQFWGCILRRPAIYGLAKGGDTN